MIKLIVLLILLTTSTVAYGDEAPKRWVLLLYTDGWSLNMTGLKSVDECESAGRTALENNSARGNALQFTCIELPAQ